MLKAFGLPQVQGESPSRSTPVFFVTLRHDHHSVHSGYDRLTDYIGEATINAKPFSARWLRNRMMWKIASGVIPYDRTSFATEIACARHMLTHVHSVYHILYGENTYRHLGWMNGRRGNHLIATFHLPERQFNEVIHTQSHLKRLAAAICVGSTQVDFLRHKLGSDRVYLIPHGIDVEFFTPPPTFNLRSNNLVLFVGNYLRDFATLRGVIELLAYARPNLQFVAVTSQTNCERIGRHPNLIIKSGISEQDLLSLYRSATLMIMPLLDATGNNALLEAMACGVPIVLTDIGSVRDYLDESCALLAEPHNARDMVEKSIAILDDPHYRVVLSERVRERALRFAWPEIARDLMAIYSSFA